MTEEDGDLRAILETLDPKARDTLRRDLIHALGSHRSTNTSDRPDLTRLL